MAETHTQLLSGGNDQPFMLLAKLEARQEIDGPFDFCSPHILIVPSFSFGDGENSSPSNRQAALRTVTKVASRVPVIELGGAQCPEDEINGEILSDLLELHCSLMQKIVGQLCCRFACLKGTGREYSPEIVGLDGISSGEVQLRIDELALIQESRDGLLEIVGYAELQDSVIQDVQNK